MIENTIKSQELTTEQKRDELIKQIELLENTINQKREARLPTSTDEKDLDKLKKALQKLDKPQRFYLYDFKTDVLEEAKKHFSEFNTPPSIYDVRKYLGSRGRPYGVGFTRTNEKEVLEGARNIINKEVK